MKPIFEQEKTFIEEMIGARIPDYCWRDGSKIYLNSNDERPLIKFKVENEKMIITNNIIENIKDDKIIVKYLKNKKVIHEEWLNKTWIEEAEHNSNRLKKIFNISVFETIKFILLHPYHDLRSSVSGGKDSDIQFIVVKESFRQILNNQKQNYKILYKFSNKSFTYNEMKKIIETVKINIENYIIDYFNPSNETAQTYIHIKNGYDKSRLEIHNPDKGWYQWLKEDKNYFLPSAMVRNCCSQYKEGKVKKLLDKKKNYIIFLGMRKYESAKRQNYDWDLNKAMGDKNNMPENWLRFLPIVEWTDQDIWFYIIKNNLKINPMYYLGFNRVGCIICPYQSDYIDLLVKKYYKHLWDRYEILLEKNYELYNIGGRLKWTLDEWKSGKWKQGTSKEQELIQKSPTEERIKELADIKGISVDLAKKYFKKECSCCNKKLNPEEIAMNLKWYGRNMNLEKMECRKCFCESNNISKDEYQLKTREYRDNGCNLF